MPGEYPACCNLGRKLLEPSGLRSTWLQAGDDLGGGILSVVKR